MEEPSIEKPSVKEPSNRMATRAVISSSIVYILAVAVAAFLYLQYSDATKQLEAAKVLQQSSEQRLSGYTKYAEYLSAAKQVLLKQAPEILTKVQRTETVEQKIEKGAAFKVSSTMLSNYTADFSFGYDLKPGNLDIKVGKAGIQVVMPRPQLVGVPNISTQTYNISNTAKSITGDAAAAQLLNDLTALATARGTALANSPEVVALCEKTVTAYLVDFLSKQNGVASVPRIEIVYK